MLNRYLKSVLKENIPGCVDTMLRYTARSEAAIHKPGCSSLKCLRYSIIAGTSWIGNEEADTFLLGSRRLGPDFVDRRHHLGTVEFKQAKRFLRVLVEVSIQRVHLRNR